MGDILDGLALSAMKTIKSGYYSVECQVDHVSVSLREALLHVDGNPVIAEIKGASPSKGELRAIRDPASIAVEMEAAGASGISILTEPTTFHGSLEIFSAVRGRVNLPLLMKDFIISPVQIDTARKLGADAVLLIMTLHRRGYFEHSLDDMIHLAHRAGLEVLLETHTPEEYQIALETDADLIGVNNRDLKTLQVDTQVTQRMLETFPNPVKPVISESGIASVDEIRHLKACGVQGFLIGTAIMQSDSIYNSVKRFVEA